MDTLRLKGLPFFGFHGTEPWEKQVGRRFMVDVELTLDLTAAGKSDLLRDAVDYQLVYAAVRDVLEGERHDLIERIAWRVMEEMFRRFPAQAARVRVTKPEAPLGGMNEGAEVEIGRTREQWDKHRSQG
jgi:dihydroneopterin aldolase